VVVAAGMIGDGGGVDRSVSELPGLRVLHRLGGDNLLRFSAVLFWIGILVWVPVVLRPDLVRPADIGSDSSNYVAAAERLVDGHSIYALVAGDRPVPQDNPPEWSGPILSPPTVATVWAMIDWLPDALRLHLTWVLGLAVATALGLFLVIRLPAWAVLLSLLALYPLGVVAWSGNINALLAPALAMVWLLFARPPTRRTDVAIGILIGVASAVKLGPAILIWWLVTQRRWWAVAVAVASVLGLGAATLLIGGTRAFTEYLQLLGSDAAAPSPLSLPGIASQLGLDPLVGYAAIVALGGLTAVLLVVLRDRPKATFGLAVLMSLVAVTIVRVETLVVGIAALAPWATRQHATTLGIPRLRAGIAAVAGLVAICGLAASVATGGLARSSMELSNAALEPILIRFTVPGQYATFGYQLLPGAVGTAWTDQMGSEQGRVVALTLDCDVLYDFPAGHPPVGWRIDPSGATELATSQSAAFLEYDSRCAEELRAIREPPR
jgi:Glycosyltransferase family 87